MAHSAKWIKASPCEPVADVAKRSLEARLERVQHFLPLATEDWESDVEHVHALRVSARRAEAALSMYWDLVPEWRAAWMDKQLRRIRNASNDARDDDVFARRLENDHDNDAAARLAHRVRQHRRLSQEAIVDVYRRLTKKHRFERRIAKLIKRVRLRGEKLQVKNPRFHQWAQSALAPMLDDFFQAGHCDFSDLEALHRFRINGKKLRYAMELLAGAFPEEFRGELYPKLEKLQDKLGQINDHVTAERRVRFWIDEARAAKKELKYLQEVLNQEKKQLRESREQFRSWWHDKRQTKMMESFRAIMKQAAANSQ